MLSGFMELLHVTPTDDTGLLGATATSVTFAIGNHTPEITLQAFPAVAQEALPIGFSLVDSSSDPVDVQIQFRRSPTDGRKGISTHRTETDCPTEL